MNAQTIPLEDQVCKCGHWYDEHDRSKKFCEGCYGHWGFTEHAYHEFEFDPEQNTPEAIADRGGDPEQWPQHVKDHFAQEAD